eukprot:6205537-Pleurochrysis_carterae.AAC.1
MIVYQARPRPTSDLNCKVFVMLFRWSALTHAGAFAAYQPAPCFLLPYGSADLNQQTNMDSHVHPAELSRRISISEMPMMQRYASTICVCSVLTGQYLTRSLCVGLHSTSLILIALAVQDWDVSTRIISLGVVAKRVADAPHTQAIMDALGHKSYNVMGWSDGAISAVLLAAAKKQRMVGAFEMTRVQTHGLFWPCGGVEAVEVHEVDSHVKRSLAVAAEFHRRSERQMRSCVRTRPRPDQRRYCGFGCRDASPRVRTTVPCMQATEKLVIFGGNAYMSASDLEAFEATRDIASW